MALGVASILANVQLASAASQTWDGGGDPTLTWSTGANWDLDSAPNVTGDSLTFAGTVGLVNSNDLVTSITGLTFDATAGAFTLSGNALTLTSGATITNNSANLQTINLNVTNGGAVNVNAAAGSITFAGTVTQNSINVTGTSGVVTLSGTGDNGFLGAMITSGTLVLAKASSGSAHAIGGNVTINGGTLQLAGTGGDQIYSQNNVTMNGGTLDLNGRSEGLNALSGAVGSVVTNSSASTTSTLTVGQNNATATFAGTIENGVGTTAFTKAGSGVQTLSGVNTYTGATTVSSGILSVATLTNGGVASGIGSSSNAATSLVLNGGVLRYTGDSVTIDRSFSGANGGFDVATAGTTLTLTGGASNASFTKSGAGSLTITGALNSLTATVSAGTLTIGGATDNNSAGALVTSGTMVLAKTSSSSVHALGGAVAVNGGTLQMGGTGGDQIYFGSSVTMAAAGIIDLNGLSEGFNGLTGVTGSTVTNNVASTTSTLIVGQNNASATFGGTIQNGAGTVAFTKAGSGTETFSGTHTYTGATTVSGGVLSVATLANGGVASGIGASSSAAGNLVLSGGVLRYTGDTVTIDRSFSGANGGFDVATAATTLTLTGNAANSSFTKSGAGALTITGVLSSLTATVSAGTLTLGGAIDNNSASATISGGTMVLAKTSTGSVHALGSAITVSGGTLQIGGTGNDQIYDGANVTLNSGTLDLNGRTEKIRGILGSGGTVTNSSATVGTLRLGGFSGASTYGGNIQDGAGAVALVIDQDNSVTVTLSGNNTYSGVTTIGVGTNVVLRAASTTALSPNSTHTLGNNTGIALDLNGFDNTVGALAGGGANGGNVTLGSAVLTTGGNNADSSYAGVISGTGGLRKIGTGTQTLTGINTYAGTTIINAGTLAINGSISGSTAVNGGSLKGTGVTGAVTVNSGGAIAPGNGIGTFTSGDLSLNGTGAFALEFNSTTQSFDMLSVTGNLSLDPTHKAVLSLTDLGSNVALASGTLFPFIEYSGTWNGGLFTYNNTVIPDDGTFTFGANIFALSYNGISGTDGVVMLQVVPEPGSCALFAGGLGMILGRRRNRRR